MEKKEVLRRLGELEELRLAVKNIPLELRFCEPGKAQLLKKNLESARLRVRQLEGAMQVLTPEERLVIHRMCVVGEKGAAQTLCQILQVEQSSVYRRRDRALRKLGNAMGGMEK